MTLIGLNAYSQAFADEIFAAWPEWHAIAVADDDDKVGGKALLVTVPSPAGSHLEQPLIISTSGGEVSVGMDFYHCHFVWPCERDDLAVELTDPIELVRLLMNEDRAVMAQFTGAEWKGSRLLTREDCQAKFYRKRPTEDWLGNVDRYRVRSWRGSLDADGGYSS